MPKYELILKNEKEKTYLIISGLLLSSNFFAIIFYSISIHFSKWGPFIFSLISVACIFLPYYFKAKKEKLNFMLAFFFFSLAWFITPYYWFGFLNLLFGVLDPISKRKLQVQFSKENIIYPSVLPKKIFWNEVSNVILKDGILTVDLKNNKLIQQYVDETIASVNEKEFNEFCKQQLSIINP